MTTSTPSRHHTVIDWVRGQQLVCLTRGLNCCPKPNATVQSEDQTKQLLFEEPVYN